MFDPYYFPAGIKKKPLPKYKKGYPKRLKLEGTKEGDAYDQLAPNPAVFVYIVGIYNYNFIKIENFK